MAYKDPMADDGLGTSSDPIAEALQTSSAFTSSTSLKKTVDDQARQSRAQADTLGDETDPIIRLGRIMSRFLKEGPTFPNGTRVVHIPSGLEATVIGSPSPGLCLVEYSPGDVAKQLSITLKAV